MTESRIAPQGPPLRRYVSLAGLYVAQAIPIYLIIAALPAIFREQGVSRSFIGAIALLFLPWILKFLWAPLIDRTTLWRRLGRRRSWILPMQGLNIVMILLLSQVSPSDDLAIIMAIMVVVAFAASTQDIATDGYAVEVLRASERAYGNAIQGGSVAVGVVLGSGLALFIYDQAGWQATMLSVAGLAALAALPLAFMESDPAAADDGPSAAGPQPSLLAFLRRREVLPVLAFALTYRCSEGLVKAMEQPFLVDKELSLTLIGLTSGVSAATVGLLGSALAALIIRKAGLFACLYGLGLARTLCFALFALAAFLPAVPALALVALAGLNTIIRYMEIVGLYSLYMGACSSRQPATDFTLLSCAQLLVYMAGSLVSGVLADWIGYGPLFTLATLLSLAAILFCMRLIPRRHPAYAGV